MANYVYIATSLDGFIATSEGGLDWLNATPNPEQSDYGYGEFLDRIDAIIMGRKTFETVLAFGQWPYPKPVFVLSHSLTSLPQWVEGKADIVNSKGNDDLSTIINQLNQRGYRHFYVDGGRTIQSFLSQDLIDELIITRIPILLGSGIPLFGTMDHSLNFKHLKTDVYNNALVKSHYVRDTTVA